MAGYGKSHWRKRQAINNPQGPQGFVDRSEWITEETARVPPSVDRALGAIFELITGRPFNIVVGSLMAVLAIANVIDIRIACLIALPWLIAVLSIQRLAWVRRQGIHARMVILFVSAALFAALAYQFSSWVFNQATHPRPAAAKDGQQFQDSNLPTPATVPLSLSQPSLGSIQFPSSTTAVSPRLEIIFKNSALFTPRRKQRIESALNAFYRYLLGMGFDPPAIVPPIEAIANNDVLGRRGGGSAPLIYTQELLVGEAKLDDPVGITLMWADCAFSTMIEAASVPEDLILRDQLATVFADYFVFSFNGNLVPAYDRMRWAKALWDIREEHGREFTDKAMFYTFKTLGEQRGPVKSFDSFFGGALRTGVDVVDNRSETLPDILTILRKHGLIP